MKILRKIPGGQQANSIELYRFNMQLDLYLFSDKKNAPFEQLIKMHVKRAAVDGSLRGKSHAPAI